MMTAFGTAGSAPLTRQRNIHNQIIPMVQAKRPGRRTTAAELGIEAS
jgi:hypothetical protein